MADLHKNDATGDDYKKKIDKLKETINESLGLSNVKIDQLEHELQEFQNELYATSQVLTTEQPSELDKLIRLYKAERSLTDVLQQKIIDLEEELTELKIDYKSYKTTESILNDFKGFFSRELAKISGTTPITNPVQEEVPVVQEKLSIQGSLEGLLSSENKLNKEERLRLQAKNQELVTELNYYQEKNDNLQKELQFRNQEVQSLKKILHEQEEEVTDEYLKKESINDEYGFTVEEEFELTKEELNTLKGKYLTLESENAETEKVIESYKKELTDLKKVLEKKNKEIKEMKRLIAPSQDKYPLKDTESVAITESEDVAAVEIEDLTQQIQAMVSDFENLQKQLHVAESQNRELRNNIKKLEEEKQPDKELLPLQQELDKKTKILWKMEKTMGVFETAISSNTETFDRHVEVYSLLLNKIYNARGYALILDTLLRHKETVMTKRMIMTEAKTEPHITIRVLRELHDSKVIHFDEQMDQIVWR